MAFESVADWAGSTDAARTSLLILWTSARPAAPDAVFDDRLRQVVERPGSPPVAVMSDCEDPGLIAQVIAGGARAFLPTGSMGLAVASKVLELVRSGGTFIPASTLMGAPASNGHAPAVSEASLLLSPRQLEVAKAMSMGLSNKMIAHELAMSEGTVKVHVKHIMRKLNARNRTEVAIRIRETDGGLAGAPV
ncbi:helix-turn-helix transcriptional regulator [Chelatococcus reniformis]|uniref:helix-turn-helix transcriptional regulator n=1 Tax=Chelatococcus reniformis TaxID=1494448 RepID=UPI001662E4B9|nr:response regulator transcription factor [Chelatococcus reniformis]